MQPLLRRTAEPVLLALVRSWGCAFTAAAPCQEAACSGVARQLATLGDAAALPPAGAQPDGEGQPAAPSASAEGPGSGDSSGRGSGGGGGGMRERPPGFPHRFNEPYRPDIRRFVHRLDQQQQPLSDSVLQGGGLPRGPADTEGLPSPHLDLVRQPNMLAPHGALQYLSEDTASTAERRAAMLRQAMLDFQRFEGDTGSSEVQVARLTQRISQLAEHMRQHRKDYASRRGLEAVIAQRRALLQYLRRKDFAAYAQLISRLGLRDTYIKLDRVTLQIQQRRERGPSKPRRGRGRR